MDNKTILITGASGLLGSYLCRTALEKGFSVIGMYNSVKPNLKGVNLVKCDITNVTELENVLKIFSPSLVIHTAALTVVDYCEENLEEAFKVNTEATINISEICKKIGAVLYYMSTTGIFDGKKSFYKESDLPNPLNIYSKSKLLAEKTVLKNSGVVIRTSVVYGWNSSLSKRKNLALWVMDELSANKKINVFTDLISTPIYAGTLAEVILKIYNKNARGVFNVCCSSSVSREEFARTVCDVFGFDKELLNPVLYKSVFSKVKRPFNDSADIGKVEHLLGIKMPTLRDDLEKMKEDSSHL